MVRYVVRYHNLQLRTFSLTVLVLVVSSMGVVGSVTTAYASIVGNSTDWNNGYQNGLANPGASCPSGHSDIYCAGWAHAHEKR